MLIAFTGCDGKSPVSAADTVNSSETQASPNKVITLKIANYYAENHPQNIALNGVFRPMIESGSKGSIRVEIYPDNQLGAEKVFIEGTKRGTIEMCIMGMMLAEDYPRLKIVEFPYIFEDVDMGFTLLNGEIGAELTEGIIENENIRPLAWNVNGIRAISNSRKPINSLDDCAGLKLRVPQVKHFIEMAKSLGFGVVTMPMSEIFTALQQKVVDGQENPPTTVLTSGWYEVQKYIALTNHMIGYNIIAINEGFYHELSDDQKQIIEKAVEAFAQKNWSCIKPLRQRMWRH